MKRALVILCALALAASAAETLENEFLKLTVAERGGKIVSLVDKGAGREIVQGQDLYGGLGKTVDSLFQNIESLSARFRLAKEGDTVKAACVMETGTLAGLEVERRFRVRPGIAAVEITERVRSTTQLNRLAPRLHNFFRFGDQADFFLPSASGLAAVPMRDCRLQKLQLVGDLREPWLAALDGEAGVALLVTVGAALDYAFVWAGQTLEVSFPAVALRPVAEADVWECQYLLLPFRGRGKVVAVTPEAVVTVDGAQAHAWFPKDLGRRRATLGGRPLGEADCRAGAQFGFAAGAGDLSLAAATGEVTVPLPAWKPRQALHQMPKRQEIGVNGFY